MDIEQPMQHSIKFVIANAAGNNTSSDNIRHDISKSEPTVKPAFEVEQDLTLEALSIDRMIGS